MYYEQLSTIMLVYHIKTIATPKFTPTDKSNKRATPTNIQEKIRR